MAIARPLLLPQRLLREGKITNTAEVTASTPLDPNLENDLDTAIIDKKIAMTLDTAVVVGRGIGGDGCRLLFAASIRESFEEMGLNPFGVQFLGPLPPQRLVMFHREIFP